MANYEEKKVYYIPAFVERIEELGNYPVKVSFPIGEERLAVQFEDLPDLMFTAEEVAKGADTNGLCKELAAENAVNRETICKQGEDILSLEKTVEQLREENDRVTAWYKEANKTASEAADANDELKAKIAELKTRNAELEALLKEVTATRDEAVKQNNELIAENEHQKSAYEEQKRLAQNWKENACKLDKEKEELFDAKERLDTAKEAITLLQQENSSLKSKLEDAEVMCGNAVDTSRKRQQTIATMEEVIVALVEKIRRLEGDD